MNSSAGPASGRPRVAILDDYQHLALKLADWGPVQSRCDVTVFDRHLEEEEAVGALRDYSVLCMLRERMPLPASLLERLPNLKLICVTGPYHRTLDLVAAQRLGITVSCTGRAQSSQFATSELAWALMLALLRHIPDEVLNMRRGGWQSTVGRSLGGRTLGLVGLGRLGAAMVSVAQAFGMKVVAWSQNMTEEKARAAGAQYVDKATLFKESDIVSLHVVLSDRTRHIVGRQELESMKPGSYLVNTSRGGLVDTQALIDVLRHGPLAGAGIDTFDIEPLPADHPLRGIPNAILTPHLGYTVEETLAAFYGYTVENITAWLAGAPLRVLTPEHPRGH
jgi:D-3-phosphoglycerate dehydrogenase